MNKQTVLTWKPISELSYDINKSCLILYDDGSIIKIFIDSRIPSKEKAVAYATCETNKELANLFIMEKEINEALKGQTVTCGCFNCKQVFIDGYKLGKGIK